MSGGQNNDWELTGATLIMIMFIVDATVLPCQQWPFQNETYIQKIMAKYWTPEMEVTSVENILQTELSYHFLKGASEVGLKYWAVLCTDKQL